MNERNEVKIKLHFAHLRLVIGGIVGFILFFGISIVLLYINGRFEEKIVMNPYLGPPPLFTATVMGFFGLVIGAILSLLSKRWKNLNIN
jgi:hypothetical protein